MISTTLNAKNLISACSTRGESLDELRTQLDIYELPFVRMDQTHSNHFKKVERPRQNEQIIPDTDACYTFEKNLVLTVKTADCLPIAFYHPKGLIGVIHAGRKGTQDGITARLFEHLNKEYSLNSEFQLWFGPAICPSCYQVDVEKDLHYDLIEENEAQLKKTISTYKLHHSKFCTSCQNNAFYSYRKEKTTLRIFTAIAQLS